MQGVREDQEGGSRGGGQPERQYPGICISEFFHTTSGEIARSESVPPRWRGEGVERGGGPTHDRAIEA